MINTLPTWKSQHAANTLSHNDVVRLLGDANETVKQLTEERDALRAALRDLLGAVTGREYPVGFGEFLDDVYPAVDNARRVLGEVKE